MKVLELKFPPVLLVIIFAVLMWFVSRWISGFELSRMLKAMLIGVIAGAGVFFMATGVLSFRQAQTTVDPTRPEKSSTLVTSGIYQNTRNPMYVGMALILVSWGVFLTNIGSLMLVAGFIAYMTRFQIIPEERALEHLYGDDFIAYKQRVRRWL